MILWLGSPHMRTAPKAAAKKAEKRPFLYRLILRKVIMSWSFPL